MASVISQVQQQCANPETTSIGTENFARMCGADGGVGACPATLSNQKVDIPGEIYGGPGVAVDGLTPGPAAGTQLDFTHHVAQAMNGGALTLGCRGGSRESKFEVEMIVMTSMQE